jgi:hypothetical protein
MRSRNGSAKRGSAIAGAVAHCLPSKKNDGSHKGANCEPTGTKFVRISVAIMRSITRRSALSP